MDEFEEIENIVDGMTIVEQIEMLEKLQGDVACGLVYFHVLLGKLLPNAMDVLKTPEKKRISDACDSIGRALAQYAHWQKMGND